MILLSSDQNGLVNYCCKNCRKQPTSGKCLYYFNISVACLGMLFLPLANIHMIRVLSIYITELNADQV